MNFSLLILFACTILISLTLSEIIQVNAVTRFIIFLKIHLLIQNLIPKNKIYENLTGIVKGLFKFLLLL